MPYIAVYTYMLPIKYEEKKSNQIYSFTIFPQTLNTKSQVMKRVKLDFRRYTDVVGDYKGITIERANQWNNGTRKRPIDLLKALQNSEEAGEGTEKLVHWFRSDLRVQDNTALWHMTETARAIGAKPIGLYVISTKFWKDHLESAYKIDLILRTLEVLKNSLAEHGIPLSVVYLDDANDKTVDFANWFEDLIQSRFKAANVYFNVLYEYDEMARDIEVMKSNLKCHIFDDQCIVPPLTLSTGKGTQYSKFTPWYKKWDEHLKKNTIQVHKITHKFPQTDNENVKDDDYSLDYDFTLESLSQFGVEGHVSLPAGENAANKLLKEWLKKVKSYDKLKDYPSKETTSRLGPYISIGSISTRTIVSQSQRLNKGKIVGGDNGIATFIKEVAWRDFYRHVIVNWPFLMLHTPFNFSSLDIAWHSDTSRFEKWCLGRTGFPIIDAAMRELLNTGYMNNRLRMVCASFLCKDLLQDWRMGEKWFHHHLVDADFISNNGGWGWCSSTGVDGQPWFRIFNVYTQSQKFDPEGHFIKKWVPELAHLDSKEIHKPPPTEDYPEPIVDREESRKIALERYRDALT